MLSGVGLGIRPELFSEVLSQSSTSHNASPHSGVEFFEAHSENYFGHSIAKQKLLELRQDFPISLHGVGLSLGRSDDLNQAHLANLKTLVNEVQPELVSEHLAWSAYSHRHIPDLLPLPLSTQALDIMCQHVEQMQEALGRSILVENPSNYLLFDQLQIPEPEFLNELARRTGCGLLLDVNNVYVSSQNVKRDPKQYLDLLSSDFIQEYHLAGHTRVQKEAGEVLIDTHNQLVCSEVWDLLDYTLFVHGAKPALLEWDSDFPEFNVLLEQCAQIGDALARNESILAGTVDRKHQSNKSHTDAISAEAEFESATLKDFQSAFIDQLMDRSNQSKPLDLNVQDDYLDRLDVYRNNTFGALLDYLADVYPATQGVLGKDYFRQLGRVFIQQQPPAEGNIHLYGENLGGLVSTINELTAYPYLSDLLRYEWQLHSLYYQDNSDVLNLNEFDQQALLEQNVEFHQAHYLFESDYPIYEIHRQSLPSYHGEVEIALQQQPDIILIHKPAWQVETLVCDKAQWDFLSLFNQHHTLLACIEQISKTIPQQEVPELLSWFFQLGLLRAKHAS